MIELAFVELRKYNKQGHNYFDRRRINIEAWYKLQAVEMWEKDQTLSGKDITTKKISLNDNSRIKHEGSTCKKPAIDFEI